MQAAWGFRFFDFWCARLGVAFNLLALGADFALQEALDAFDLQRSGLVIWSIPRGDWAAAEDAVLLLPAVPAWHKGRVIDPATLSVAPCVGYAFHGRLRHQGVTGPASSSGGLERFLHTS